MKTCQLFHYVIFVSLKMCYQIHSATTVTDTSI